MLESAVLSVSRTGNPILDAILAACLLALLTKGTSVVKSYASLWWEKYYKRPLHSLEIAQWDPNGYGNKTYEAIRWYLNKEAPVTAGAMKAFRTILYEAILPSSLQLVPFMFEGHPMDYYMVEPKTAVDDKGRSLRPDPPSIVIRTCENPLMLTQLLRKANELHEQHTKLWSQHVHMLEIDSPKQVRWSRFKTDSTKNIDNLVMEPGQKQKLVDDLNRFLENENWYKKMGLTWKRGYLMYGEPGCGKSSAVSAISDFCKYDIYIMNLSVFETDDTFRVAFRQIPSKALVVFEDVDCDTDVTHLRREEAKQKVNLKDNKEMKIDKLTLSTILNELDGVGSQHGRLVVMTTNRAEILDPALTRPGRMDMHFLFKKCSREMYQWFFGQFFPDFKMKRGMLESIPDNVLTPAQVGGIFLKNQNDRKQVLEDLGNEARLHL